MKVRPKRFSSEYSAESVTCIVAWMKWLDRTGLDDDTNVNAFISYSVCFSCAILS